MERRRGKAKDIPHYSSGEVTTGIITVIGNNLFHPLRHLSDEVAHDLIEARRRRPEYFLKSVSENGGFFFNGVSARQLKPLTEMVQQSELAKTEGGLMLVSYMKGRVDALREAEKLPLGQIVLLAKREMPQQDKGVNADGEDIAGQYFLRGHIDTFREAANTPLTEILNLAE